MNRRRSPACSIALAIVALLVAGGCEREAEPQIVRAVLDQNAAEAHRQSEEYARQLETSAEQMQRFERQLERTDQQLQRNEAVLARNESQLERAEVLLKRQEKQADRYDKLLDRWEAEGRPRERP